MSKKKIGIAVGAVVAVAAITGGVWVYQSGGFGGIGDNGDRVYVESVADLTNQDMGVQNRYSGVVEAQESWNLNVDSERTIKEVFVKVGDKVEAGTPLLSYDTDEIQDEIAKNQLDLEGSANNIAAKNQEIAENTKLRDAAADADKFEYVTEIQSAQADIREEECNQKTIQATIDKLNQQLNDSVVTSKIKGTVKNINNPGASTYSGDSDAYMTILATGDYKVKGIANEQNIKSLTKGDKVIMHSRVDDSITWKGKITKVDTENALSNSNEDEGDNGMSSSKYPFYVKLSSSKGLMLGQHLYLELDFGQAEEKEGIWLNEGYIVQNEKEKPYVWAENEKGKLEKREVELGEHDENELKYEIKKGLKEEDKIAYPMASFYEGVRTVNNADDVDYESPMYSSEDGSDVAEPVEGMDEDSVKFGDGIKGEGTEVIDESADGDSEEVVDDTEPNTENGDDAGVDE